MDGSQTPAPFRDARYAPRRLDVERRDDGTLVLTNPTPWSDKFLPTTAALDHWAAQAPDRVWLAERDGRQAAASQRINRLREQHKSKWSFIKRLDEKKLGL